MLCVSQRPPREDWAKDEEGYWSRRLKRVADNPHLCQLSQNELQVGGQATVRMVPKSSEVTESVVIVPCCRVAAGGA